jgi:hypothetical protein
MMPLKTDQNRNREMTAPASLATGPGAYLPMRRAENRKTSWKMPDKHQKDGDGDETHLCRMRAVDRRQAHQGADRILPF